MKIGTNKTHLCVNFEVLTSYKQSWKYLPKINSIKYGHFSTQSYVKFLLVIALYVSLRIKGIVSRYKGCFSKLVSYLT